MDKKYELHDVGYLLGKKLYDIRALKSFDDVKKGDIGGVIESEDNLSHDGNCWIYKGSIAYDNVFIGGNAKIREGVYLHDSVCIIGDAEIEPYYFSALRLDGNMVISGNARIKENNDYLHLQGALGYEFLSFWKAADSIEVFIDKTIFMEYEEFKEDTRLNSDPVEYRFMQSLFKYIEEKLRDNQI